MLVNVRTLSKLSGTIKYPYQFVKQKRMKSALLEMLMQVLYGRKIT